MKKFGGYHQYRKGDEGWLSKIPVGWGLTRAKFAYDIQLGKMLTPEPSSDGDQLHPYLRAANVHWAGVDVSDINRMWFTPQDKSRYEVEEGDVLVCEGGDVGRSAVWDGSISPCFIQNSLHRVRSRGQFRSKYLYYILFAAKAAGHIDMLCSKATIPHFTYEKLGSLTIPAPTLSEQAKVVSYLDREVGRLEGLIEKKRRLIELLEEMRTALISHAVTKGLDPNAPMKKSGVEWLGEIPEHWRVARIGSIASKLTNGYVGPTRGIYVDQGVPYLQSLHIKSGRIKFSGKEYFVPSDWSQSHEKSIVKEGDLLIVQTGSIGEVACVPEAYDGANCHALIIIQCHGDTAIGEYLEQLFLSHYGKHSLLWSKTGALHPHLKCGDVRQIPVPLPPIDEQQDIVAFLADKDSHYRQLRAMLLKVIELLSEYRTSVITSAVTGKIDVRDEVEVPA